MEIYGIIIQNTFTSVGDIIDRKYRIFQIFKCFLSEKWDNISVVGKKENDENEKNQ